MNRMKILAGMLIAASLAVPAARADDTLKSKLESISDEKRAKVLAVAEKNQDAIVMVEFVVNIQVKVEGQESPAKDQKITLPGTVLTPEGLTAVSNANADPGKVLEASLRARARGRQVDVQTSITEAKIILNDSTEIEAEIAIRDEDVSLLLVRPKKSLDKPLPCVTLSKKAEPKVLDTVIGIARLGLDAGRAVMITTGTIKGTIEKPRKYYVAMPVGPGLPVFDKDGNAFGLCLPRMSASGLPGGTEFILPASDILDIIAQIKPKEKEEE